MEHILFKVTIKKAVLSLNKYFYFNPDLLALMKIRVSESRFLYASRRIRMKL